MSGLRLRARQAIGEAVALTGRRPARASLSVLMYHAVTPDAVHDPGQESVSAAMLDRQMACLTRSGVRVVALDEGLATLEAARADAPMASVVFDDGYAGLHDHALEILRRYDVPATVFLATAAIGTPRFSWAPHGIGRPLSWPEARRLVDAGWTVGSHTHDHAVLSRVPPREAREQLRRSRDTLADRLGVTTRLFAYPYGSYGTFDAGTAALLADEGFAAACTTVWGRQRRGDDPFEVRRMRVAWCDGPREILKLVAGCYDWYRAVQRLQARRAR